jgi:predicted RNA binding protein YcfA (HicA-like mRNA interferase family)
MRVNTHIDSRTIFKKLEDDGWYKVGSEGSHVQFCHPEKKGRVTVPHPKKDISIKTLKSIERQSGIKLR